MKSQTNENANTPETASDPVLQSELSADTPSEDALSEDTPSEGTPSEDKPSENELAQAERFFEDAAVKDGEKKNEEDPFFSPLPEIDIPDDDAADTDEETTYISEQVLADNDSAADNTSAEDNGEPETTTEPSESPEEKSHRLPGRVLGIIAGALGGTAVLIFAVLCIILFRLSGPITVDLDETVSLGALETHPILSVLTTAEPTPAAIDTSVQGEKQIDLTFFGFLPRTVNVSVRDLTLPAVTAYRMTVGVGELPQANDCVLSCEDKTAVTHVFAEEPNTSTAGEYTVILLSTDEGGNTTQTDVIMTVASDTCTQNAEFGATAEDISALFATAYPAYPSFDLTAVDSTVCGTYRVTATAETERAILSLILSDTTAPTGKVHSFDLLSGMTLSPEDFVTDIKDASSVTLSYKTAPDYNSLAPQSIAVLAQDAHGNETEFSCSLQIWNIADKVTAECGTTLDALKTTLFTKMTAAGAELPTFDRSFDPAALAPGTYDVRLHGKYSKPTVSLTMVDTTAPKLTLKSVTAYIGHALTPEMLVDTVEDATEVKLTFKTAPDVSGAGTLQVTVIAEDAGGNKTEAQTAVTVIADTAAPQIYGVKTIYAQQNGTVSYRSGVSAYDNADGNVAVKVDASRVDVTKVGKYTVVYTATDKAGNTATHSALVYVTGANQASVNLYADEILASILTPGMTDRQKALAIYNWCVGHLRYSTATSHLMGHFIEAAYSGFTKHIGNCYTYYAVASSLLTRAGIENIEIQRNNPNAPHYWNLVKIGGNWYHLDTCPKWKSYPIKTFLLTDAQVRHYSQTQNIGYYSFDASRYPATP